MQLPSRVLDFADAPPANDNDMPRATGRAPKPPKVAPADMSRERGLPLTR